MWKKTENWKRWNPVIPLQRSAFPPSLPCYQQQQGFGFFLSFPTLLHYLSKSIIDRKGFLNLSASSFFYVFKSSLKTYVQWRFTYSKQLLTTKHTAFLPFCYLMLFILYFLTNPYSIFFFCRLFLNFNCFFFKLESSLTFHCKQRHQTFKYWRLQIH